MRKLALAVLGLGAVALLIYKNKDRIALAAHRNKE